MSNISSSSSSSDAQSYSSDEEGRQAMERAKQNIRRIMDELIRNHVPQMLSAPTRRNTRKKKMVQRDREEGEQRLMRDYFAPDPVYGEALFRRRFRMHRHVFLRIVGAVQASDRYFQQRPDATGRLGLSVLQKCTAAIRMLAYGSAADALDEYLRLGESTTHKCLHHFIDGVINNFGDEYLRKPNAGDLQRLLHMGQQCGFSGMLGSIDCMH